MLSYSNILIDAETKPIKNIFLVLNSIIIESDIEYYYKYNNIIINVISKRNETLDTFNACLTELSLYTLKVEESTTISHFLLASTLPVYFLLTYNYKKSL